jgi:hypothetical protein
MPKNWLKLLGWFLFQQPPAISLTILTGGAAPDYW